MRIENGLVYCWEPVNGRLRSFFSVDVSVISASSGLNSPTNSPGTSCRSFGTVCGLPRFSRRARTTGPQGRPRRGRSGSNALLSRFRRLQHVSKDDDFRGFIRYRIAESPAWGGSSLPIVNVRPRFPQSSCIERRAAPRFYSPPNLMIDKDGIIRDQS